MTIGSPTVVVDGVAVRVRGGETVFNALMRAGVRLPWACRRGRCAACKVQLVSGKVLYTMTAPRKLFSDEERASGVCLSCTAVPLGDLEVHLAKVSDESRGAVAPRHPTG